MYKIILFHLVFFAALFGLVMPGLNVLTGTVDFGGGMLAVAVMTLLSEVVVVAGGVLGRIVGDALGINPLLQRKKSEALSASLLTVLFTGFLLAGSALFPALLSVTLASSLLISVGVVAVLFVALHIKRAIIAGQK
ncbi:MAG: hypothetical protein K2Y39_21835 [Candidatus Obscuribacterales bacterium]|nr:hypothetical protein [Candidatus Obscuribacterales bacterium]